MFFVVALIFVIASATFVFSSDSASTKIALAVFNSSSVQVSSTAPDLISTQTAPDFIDADGDGYGDAEEITAGFSPFNPLPVRAIDSDVDGDGLSDYHEILFGADTFKTDTDGDGYGDFLEIDNGYNPLATSSKKMPMKIEIRLKGQKLDFYVSGHKWKEFTVSTGKPSAPTPTGEFTIVNKIKKAWSRSYGLWMPYWLGLNRGRIGIHELPVWPSGYREGKNNLGRPVSHGCIRLDVGPAQYLFERVETGTKVFIKP